MILLYSVCYYWGKNKVSNIKEHINSFKKIRKSNDIFLLNVMIDSEEKTIHQEIKKLLSDEITSYNIPFVILTSFNWGGTILGLWMTYQYCKLNYKNAYIAHFEEDFISHNINWLEDSKKMLNSEDYIYIGEHVRCITDKRKNYKNTKLIKNDTRKLRGYIFKDIYSKYNCNIIDSRYTDGGYYFSNLKNLKMIENKIGIFHKGNQNTKWDHVVDGIIIGEVGFPSQVAQHFDFIGLNRDKYFIHEY